MVQALGHEVAVPARGGRCRFQKFGADELKPLLDLDFLPSSLQIGCLVPFLILQMSYANNESVKSTPVSATILAA